MPVPCGDQSSYNANVAFAISNSRMITSLCLSDRGVNHAGNFLGEKTKPSEYPVETVASTSAEESGLDSMLKPQESLAIFRIFVAIRQLASVYIIWHRSRSYIFIGKSGLTREFSANR